MKLSKGKKQVAILYVATIGSTFLGLIASIINTRYLNEFEYGNVRYVQNLLNFISSFLLFGYFLSGSRLLALSNNENNSRQIRGCLIVILVLAQLLMLVGCSICYGLHYNNNEHLAILFLYSLPVSFYPLLGNYMNNVTQGDNHIGRLSLSRFLPYAIYIPVAYLLYKYTGASDVKMILLQWGLYSLVLIILVLSTRPLFNNLRETFSILQKENKAYGIQLYFGSLVMVATNYIAGITLGLFNDNNVEVGFYTLALTVTTPLSMLPSVIGTTFFKEFARQPKIPSRIFKITILMTFFSCLLFIILIKPIVVYLYTERYAPVGMYAAYLSVGFSVHGIGDMINRFLGSHGQGKSIRNSSIINGVFKIFGFTVLVYFFNTPGALITNIICSTIYCLVLVYYYLKFIKSPQLYEKL